MLDLKKLTLTEVLRNSLESYPDNPSVGFVNSDPLTYSEFFNRVNQVSDFLHENGIISGDKVAILSENQPNWAIVFFAVTSIGAVLIPIMTEFHSSQVQHIINHSEAKALFVSSRFSDKLEGLSIPAIRLRFKLDDFSLLPEPEASDSLLSKPEFIKKILSDGAKEFARIKESALKFLGKLPQQVEQESVALIIYTSGTTGHSKGVILTHKNIVSNALSTLGFIQLDSSDRMLSILPLFHTMESTLGLVIPFIRGASVYYIEKPPTPAVLLPALAKVKPTVMLAVPLIIEKIFRVRILPELNRKFIIKSLYKLPAFRKKFHKIAAAKLMKTFGGELKLFCIGGASLSADVERFLNEGSFPYAIGYGLTETSPLNTGTDPSEVRLRSAGKAIPDVQVKIDNPDTKTGEGEILIKGPNVMKGYYKDPEKTKEVFTDDGWFKTGDLGIIDKDGYLFIKGRSKNVIIGSNGKNIYPEEIESILNELDFVSESLVVERKGELTAKIFLNYETIEAMYKVSTSDDRKTRELVNEILTGILKQVNERVNTFSRINKVVEQLEPFEKTPTQKIKRYLYN